MQAIKCWIYYMFYPLITDVLELGINVKDPHAYEEQGDGTLQCSCCGWSSWDGGEGFIDERRIK